MKNKGSAQNIIAIIIILVVVFLSQQAGFGFVGRDIYGQGSKYWAEASAWVKTNVSPKVSGGVSAIKASTGKEIITQKNNFLQNIWEKMKTFFTQQFSNIFKKKTK